MLSLLRNLGNSIGWSTERKLIVLESDDWGSLRMPSNEVYDSLSGLGFDFTQDDGYRYNRYDTLATTEDLSLLFEVLQSVGDANGRPAVFTPVSIVANPDFDRIRKSDFNDYFFEPFTETLKRFRGCEDSFALWKEGVNKRLFIPQFHGREHLNVKTWMRALQANHQQVKTAFNHGFWGISTAYDQQIKIELQAAFDFIDPSDVNYHREVIISGLNLFEELFGYRAGYFVPPNGPFSSRLESACSDSGIKYLFSPKIQVEPIGYKRSRRRFHWAGQKGKSGLTFLNRNCFFEPGDMSKDWVDGCLYDISMAFRWKKPAVISSHRVNYIGALDKQNRGNGLRQLSRLLKQILMKWPGSEFVTPTELGDLIINEKVLYNH